MGYLFLWKNRTLKVSGLVNSLKLLLKWGGDPRCRVIFTDSYSDPHSLARELRTKALYPPIIATVTRPMRVELSGVELMEYRKGIEKKKKMQEEAAQRKRRLDELSLVSL